ncbi:MAG: hypothetical protein V7736_16755 [Colwellia polaris]|jgi:hypothetical protein|uniref:hypothetical protein n=1 Tax=Colwellia polaris TaxID=326537 RepID=UPI000A1734CA|nr:hypothetical protein [Colwellia polaris]|tara:strand:- start:6607 stop:7194 length:588 start_codon:yes stop_codon:yes gene_type:complete
MNMFDIAIFCAAIAGLIMVIGGIILIYKGALVLASTDPSSALTIEWKKEFRLNTQAPGIAFFIIGLLFTLTSIFASKPTEIEPINIIGKVAEISEPITIAARSSKWILVGGSDGVVKGKIRPYVEAITLEISAPGYKPINIVHILDELKDRTIHFEQPIQMEQLVTGVVGTQIIDVPDEGAYASVNSPAKFGVSQ